MIGHVLLAGAMFTGAGAAVTLVDSLQADHGVPKVAAEAAIAAARTAPCPVSYKTLVSVMRVESGFGTHGGNHLDDNGDLSGAVESQAGAVGPMQFMPATWAQYKSDGNGDGVMDVNNVFDATVASAKLLCADNVDESHDDAVCAYNGGGDCWQYQESRDYVGAVAAGERALPDDDGAPVAVPTATPNSVLTEPGHLCLVGEWLADPGTCLHTGRLAMLGAWVGVGTALDREELPKLHMAWQALNGVQPTAPARDPAQPTATAGGTATLPLPLDALEAAGGPNSLMRAHHDYPAADIPVPEGTPVFAPEAGTATRVEDSVCGLGWTVTTTAGREWVVCHLSRQATVSGRVQAGQQLGLSGSTGNSTGPHLHLGLKIADGTRVCPGPALVDLIAGHDTLYRTDCAL